MQMNILIALAFFSSLSFAKGDNRSVSTFVVTANDWKASHMVNEYICSQDSETYSIEKEFKSLFSSSYLNRDMKGVKTVSKAVLKEMRASCDQEGYFSFNLQRCVENCHQQYPTGPRGIFSSNDEVPVKGLLMEQCQAACASVSKKVEEFINTAARLMDRKKLVDAKNCSSETKEIADTIRGAQKENLEGPVSGKSSGHSAAKD